MNKKDLIPSVAILGLTGAFCAYNEIVMRRQKKKIDRILKSVESPFPILGAEYNALHQGFLQDPKVKEAMHIIDTNTIDDLN